MLDRHRRREACRTNVAIKPTHLGLALDEELAYANVGELVAHAAERGNFVRMDMEESRSSTRRCASTAGSARRAIDNVGIVLQSYLYRTQRDLEELLPLRRTSASARAPTWSLRRSRTRRRRRRRRLCATGRALAPAGGFTAIATHDERMIEHAIAFAERHGSRRSDSSSRCSSACGRSSSCPSSSAGYEVLVATPYGPDWYRYLMRRLAERPANIGFLLRNLVRG